ncbi:MAG: hypothetical protein CVU90_02425 [Firmicutes bacterium HGW-Firmicutes-15]|nr:MAG: hypothetical protein CVU90_02425 [Firmicutes bacterium HGW-Firmicutes-15]
MNTAVVIMSKTPVPGYTKTRLISVLSPQECVAFHRACLNDIVKNINVLGLPVFLYYAPAPLEDKSLVDWQDNSWWELSEELLSNVSMYPQLGKDLGERMYQASLELLSNREAVVFLGSDLPDIPTSVLIQAMEKLDSNDVVIGPAEDGGYYLLGIKQAYSGLFENISWGSSEVLVETLDRIKRNGLSFALLKIQRDIDTWEDMQDYYLRGQEYVETQNLDSYQVVKEVIERFNMLSAEDKG